VSRISEAGAELPRHRTAAAAGLWRPLFWIPLLVLLAADLWTKNWAFGFCQEGGIQPVWGDWLAIKTLRNPGGVFGMLQGLTTPLAVFRAVAVVAILWLLTRQPRCAGRAVFTLGLLAAGALGNRYDNLSAWAPWPGNGFVRDFVMVDLGFWPFHPWPIFNLADACITVGFLMLITGFTKVRLGSGA